MIQGITKNNIKLFKTVFIVLHNAIIFDKFELFNKILQKQI